MQSLENPWSYRDSRNCRDEGGDGGCLSGCMHPRKQVNLIRYGNGDVFHGSHSGGAEGCPLCLPSTYDCARKIGNYLQRTCPFDLAQGRQSRQTPPVGWPIAVGRRLRQPQGRLSSETPRPDNPDSGAPDLGPVRLWGDERDDGAPRPAPPVRQNEQYDTVERFNFMRLCLVWHWLSLGR